MQKKPDRKFGLPFIKMKRGEYNAHPFFCSFIDFHSEFNKLGNNASKDEGQFDLFRDLKS